MISSSHFCIFWNCSRHSNPNPSDNAHEPNVTETGNKCIFNSTTIGNNFVGERFSATLFPSIRKNMTYFRKRLRQNSSKIFHKGKSPPYSICPLSRPQYVRINCVLFSIFFFLNRAWLNGVYRALALSCLSHIYRLLRSCPGPYHTPSVIPVGTPTPLATPRHRKTFSVGQRSNVPPIDPAAHGYRLTGNVRSADLDAHLNGRDSTCQNENSKVCIYLEKIK